MTAPTTSTPLTRPTIAVTIHDGFYSAGTGAGYANRAFLRTLTTLLPSNVQLIVLPVLLDPTSNEYDPGWRDDTLTLLYQAGASHIPVDNGTGGQTRFGTLDAFQRLGVNTATALERHVLPHAEPLAIIAFDAPFLGLPHHLPSSHLSRLTLVPRSSALLHDPANTSRVAFEHVGLHTAAHHGGHIAAISSHMRRHLQNDYQLPSTALVDLPDGLTAADWHFAPADPALLPPQAQHGFLLAMGRAQPYKGWDDLIDALALLQHTPTHIPHAVLAAVTEITEPSAYQNHLAARITTLGIDATLITRFDHNHRNLLTHPRLSGVIVPSRTEPFGRVPLEAYAAGAAPLIATRAGGLTEQVQHGTTGILADPGNPAALAQAIEHALALTPTRRECMRQAGRQFATHYNHDRATREFVARIAPWASPSGSPLTGSHLSSNPARATT